MSCGGAEGYAVLAGASAPSPPSRAPACAVRLVRSVDPRELAVSLHAQSGFSPSNDSSHVFVSAKLFNVLDFDNVEMSSQNFM